jgi:thioesterase domain-containing protein
MGLAVDVVVMVDASASNARHRWLRRLIEGVGVVFRLKRHERMDWFISARRVLLRGASARDARRTAGILIEKIRRRVGTTGAPAARRPRDEQSWPGGLSQPEKDFAFHRAVDGYVPGPYRGRIVLLRTDSMLSRTPGDPSIGWRHVNPDVEVHAIPGAHMTCLTEHVESLARCLAGCLRDGAADPGSRTSPARVRHGRGSPSRAR